MIKATYPTEAFKQYLYENSGFPSSITKIIDENGNVSSEVMYDSEGRPISSSADDGVDLTTVCYNWSSIGSTPPVCDAEDNPSEKIATVTNALGKVTKYHFITINNVPKTTWVEGISSTSCAASNSHYLYNAQGLVTLKIDGEGNVTTYEYDEHGLEIERTEGLKLDDPVPTSVITEEPDYDTTSATRTITTTWNTTLRLPLTITYPNKVITNTYDSAGKLLTTSESVPE